MLSGALVQISRFGEAFQIGTGAHLNNPAVFGASGWLDFDVLSQPTDGPVLNGNTAHGDFNFELPVGPGLLDVPSCAEICEGGSVELFAFGFSGAAPYGFEWSNGSTGASISVSPAASTTYSVNITDANGCTATATIDVTVNGAPMISCSPENGACGAFGSASVTASGGSGTYSYSWSNGETSASITDLASGSYTVTVTDTETGCSDDCTVVIDNTPAIVADCSSMNGACGALGSASVTASGGSGTYSYSWSNGETSASITDLASGSYTVTVTDTETGCSDECTVVINNTPAIVADCSSMNGACGALGSASVTASGGSDSYSYAWSNGASGAMVTDLASGSYTVTVTDTETGCSDECTVVINNTPAIVADCSSTDGECGALGSASVTASGGSNSYSYAWSNGASGAMVTDLATGSYTVTVTDTETGCSDECTVVINNTPAIVADCSSTDGECGALGSASVTASGGSDSYSYAWSNGASGAMVTDLASGSYTVTVTDTETGCSDECTVVIDNTPALTVSCSDGGAVCDGGLTGTASATAGGGTGDYSYAWDNGATTASISGLAGGTYTVTVTDEAGCEASCSVTVGTFPQPMAAIDCADINLNTTISMVADSDPTCNNNPNYAFWFNNLLPGNKYWTVTDGLFDVFADGTASFTGTVTNVGNANWSFTVDAVFSGKDRCPSCRFAQVGQLCL